MKESVLRLKIKHALEDEFRGFWITIHGGPYQVVGLPDIIGCVGGKFYGLEVKVPGKERTLTARQAFILQQIKLAGGRAKMVTSVDEALSFVRRSA